MAIESVTCPNCGEAQAAHAEKIRAAEVKAEKLARLYRRLLVLTLAFAVLISLVSAVLWILAEAEDAVGAPVRFTELVGAIPLFGFAWIAAFIIFSIVLVAPTGIIMGIIVNKRKMNLKTLIAAHPLNPDS